MKQWRRQGDEPVGGGGGGGAERVSNARDS